MKAIIPPAALEQHIAVLGKSGSGKSFATKAVVVEPLLQAGKHVVIVDPTSAWYGLRSSADGAGPGFKVIVLGGDHGDMPLPARGGEAVARLAIEQRVNLVADTGNLTVGERTRWMMDFASALYRLNRAPLYLVLDEAHNFAPQGKVPDPDTGKMLHSVNQIASGGRSRGIRLTMITQRPQKLHKDALTTADTLIAMRVLAPHDREAVKAWVDGCGDPAQGKQVLDSLAGLKRGEGWVWYPEGGHLVRAHFPRIKTFDSSATPTEGRVLEQPKGAADVDLTEIRKALAEAVQEAEANDPNLLRAEIARLRAAASKVSGDAISADALSRELAAAEQRGYLRGRREASQVLRDADASIGGCVAIIGRELKQLAEVQKSLVEVANAEPAERAEQTSRVAVSRAVAPPAPRPRDAGNGSVPRAERLILTALAQYPQGRTRTQVAILTGYSVDGGGFKNALGALRSAGRVEGSEPLKITAAGLEALGAFDSLPHGRALLDHWYGQLGKAERKALEALAEVYPRTLSRAQLAARAGYDADGGGFKNALGRLRSLELVTGRAEMKASEDLFDG